MTFKEICEYIENPPKVTLSDRELAYVLDSMFKRHQLIQSKEICEAIARSIHKHFKASQGTSVTEQP
jgi:hypothetical protein